MRRAVALYPFSSQLLPIVRHFERLQDNYSLCKLVSLPGLGLIGKDAAFSCNHLKTGLTVVEDVEMEESEWEILFLMKPDDLVKIDDHHLGIIAERALQAGKTVAFFTNSNGDVPQKIWDLTEMYPSTLSLHTGDIQKSIGQRTNDSYCHFDTPVILVGGLVEGADILEILLRLTVLLRDNGLCPMVFSKQSIGEVFGFHRIDNILSCIDMREDQKIREINWFIKALEHDERPDIILLEAPDALMRYNDLAPNGFGILSYMLCQAVNPNGLFCCVPFELTIGAFVEALSGDFALRFGAPICAVQVSNIIVDSMEMLQTHSISYVHADLASVHQQITNKRAEFSIPLFDVIGNGMEDLCGVLNNFVDLRY